MLRCWFFFVLRDILQGSFWKAPDVEGSRCPASHQLNFLTIFPQLKVLMYALIAHYPQKISRDVEEVQGGPSSLCTVFHIRQGNSKTKSSGIMLTCILYLLLALMFNTLIILYPVNELTSVMFYFFLPVCIQIWVKLLKFEIFCRNRKVLWKCRKMNLTRC